MPIFGEGLVEVHIPGLVRQFGDQLEVVGEAGQPRALPVAAVAAKGQAAVVPAATHAQAMALAVEGHQRHQYQI